MSRWLPLAKKDGRRDEFVTGLVTHTVTRGDETTQYLAFRLKRETGSSDLLGGFPTPHAARKACEDDALRHT